METFFIEGKVKANNFCQLQKDRQIRLQVTASDYKWLRVTTSDYKWLRAWGRVTASDYKRLRVTTSDCEWLQATTSQRTSDYEWLQATTSDYNWLRAIVRVTTGDYKRLRVKLGMILTAIGSNLRHKNVLSFRMSTQQRT